MRRTIIDPKTLELNDRVVAIKRVSKTVKGGRTMRFSALVVVGDGNGHVGAGLGKAAEVPEAIRKGKEAAMKNLVEIPLDKNQSVPHDFFGVFGSSTILLKRAPEGTGVIAGGPARAVIEMVGIKSCLKRQDCGRDTEITGGQSDGREVKSYAGKISYRCSPQE